jgi:predicted dehydrogenase
MARRNQRVSLAFNRRDFLRTSIAIPTAAGAAYFAYQKLEGGPVRTVIVGTGVHGRESLIRQAPLGAIDFRGFYDIRPSQIALAWKEFAKLYGAEGVRRVTQYRKWEEILDDKSIEAVVIATPTPTHAKLAMEAIRAGKHVYVEAPIADSSLDAKAIVNFAYNNRKVLAVGYQRNANRNYLEAAKHFRNRDLGDVNYVETVCNLNFLKTDPWKAPISEADLGVPANQHGYSSVAELIHWRTEKSLGGMFTEVMSHQLDAVRALVGDYYGQPIAVRGIGTKALPGRPNNQPDHIYVIVEYPDEQLVVTWAGISTNGSEGMVENVLGTRGTLWINNEWDLQVALPPQPAPPGGRKPARSTAAISMSVESASKGAPTMYSAASAGYTAASNKSAAHSSRGFTEGLRSFAECIRGRGTVACSGSQAVMSLVLSLAAQRAVKENKRIVLEQDWFKLDSVSTPDEKPKDLSIAKEAGLPV